MAPDPLERVRSLLDGPSPATLTTCSSDGTALTTPVWFRWWNGSFEVVVAEGDAKLRNLRRDPRCSLLVFEAVPPFRGVEVSGDAELIEGDVSESRAAISGRYLGAAAGARFAAERTKPGVLVRLGTDHLRIWDLSAVLPASTPLDDQLASVAALVQRVLGANVSAIYLYGSAVKGGLKPASDVDLFVVTRRRTTRAQKRRLAAGLKPISARDTRPPPWRPVELTIVVQSDIRPWRYPPRMDFQYGEWLRARFDAGDVAPISPVNPDLAVLISMVALAGRPLLGPPPAELLDPVPRADLIRAMTDGVADLIADIDIDTANVLLTLARIWSTLETSTFLTKDAAADWVIARMPPESQAALERARALYLGRQPDSWADEIAGARAAAYQLVGEIERLTSRTYNRSR